MAANHKPRKVGIMAEIIKPLHAKRRKPESRVGEKYAKLEVLSVFRDENGVPMANCRCDCGNESTHKGRDLFHGSIISCGCARNSHTKREFKNGKNKRSHPLYHTWTGMRRRCHDKDFISFRDYGARGITVCEFWLADFYNFASDVGTLPADGMTIDRIENDLGYWCGHCEECVRLGREKNWKWATTEEQANHKRGLRMITHEGITLSTKQWSEKLGVPYDRFHDRIKDAGMSIAQVIANPPRPRSNFLTHKGITRTIGDWCRLTGISHNALVGRIKSGWSEDRILHDRKDI